MANNLNFEQAAELFSSNKKTLKLLDKTFSKEQYEYILKLEDNGLYGIYTNNDIIPICVDSDVLKAFMGVLYFDFGVGKQGSLPYWAQSRSYFEEKWAELSSRVDEEHKCAFPNINSALNHGSILYSSNTSDNTCNNFLLTNPFNANFTDKIIVRSDSFSDGISQVDSIAEVCLRSCVQEQ